MIIVAVSLTVAALVYFEKDSFKTLWAMTGIIEGDYAPAEAPAVTTATPSPSAVEATNDDPASLTGFAAKFSNSLMFMDDGGTARAFDTSKLAGVKYWAFYYSASWCPPCRSFTPDLVSFYRGFKPDHPDFELIFVNLDKDEDAMENYMRSDSMPWPAIWYADIDNPELEAKKYCGAGIPCLVLVDSDGNVMSDSFQDGQYVGPQHVIDDIQTMVK
jgi:nucleoredoxin